MLVEERCRRVSGPSLTHPHRVSFLTGHAPLSSSRCVLISGLASYVYKRYIYLKYSIIFVYMYILLGWKGIAFHVWSILHLKSTRMLYLVSPALAERRLKGILISVGRSEEASRGVPVNSIEPGRVCPAWSLSFAEMCRVLVQLCMLRWSEEQVDTRVHISVVWDVFTRLYYTPLSS